ncbi:MAG: arsenate reductase ArsC [Myxococcota bacterium]|nr:arsenate reductase ArsC [Myxococcota bacterium]MEC9391649.1 arsenate reductase ArsC [Myxococcota bacterium]
MAGILFLCVANSARSQLAEAIARDLAPELDIWSAGSEPTHVRPQVRRVLNEAGFDDKGLRSKSLYEVEMDEIDVIVTLCRQEQCPILPGKKRHVHWPLPDPAAAPDDEKDEAFRATRDELIRRLPALIRDVEARA